MKRLNSGFTLIKLTIVVAIVGILAAIAIPQYQNYVARAQVSEALVLASGAKMAVAEYFNTNRTFPADNAEAGLSDAADISDSYVESVTVSVDEGKAVITVLFSSTDANFNLQGGEMTLTAVDTGGSIGFSCIGTTAATDITAYLPSNCAAVRGTALVVAPVTGDPGDAMPVAWVAGAMGANVTACYDVATEGWVAGTNGFTGDQEDVRRLADGDDNDTLYVRVAFGGGPMCID